MLRIKVKRHFLSRSDFAVATITVHLDLIFFSDLIFSPKIKNFTSVIYMKCEAIML